MQSGFVIFIRKCLAPYYILQETKYFEGYEQRFSLEYRQVSSDRWTKKVLPLIRLQICMILKMFLV